MSVNGPYGKMKFVTTEVFEGFMTSEPEPEIVVCFDEEPEENK